MTLADLAWNAQDRPDAYGVDSKHFSTALNLKKCFLCGTSIELSAYKKASVITETFTGLDQCRAVASDYVCRACAWSLKAVVNERKKDGVSSTGREKRAPWMRCFSVFADSSYRVIFLTKADRALIISLIKEKTDGREQPNWGLALADSGQKQLIWRTPINKGGAETFTVRLEEKLITTDIGSLIQSIEAVETLRSVFTIAEIESGDYESRRIMTFGLERWQSVDSIISSIRHSSLLELSIWLSVAPPKEGVDGSKAISSSARGDVAAGMASERGSKNSMGSNRVGSESECGEQRQLGQDSGGHITKTEVRPKSVGGHAGREQLGFGW